MTLKTTDYHRTCVAKYYGQLCVRYGLARLIKWIPRLKQIVWTTKGFELVEKHIGSAK